MSIENLVKVLEQTDKLLIHGQRIKKIRLDGNGEPLLYENIKQAIIESKTRFPECTITTNGTLLSEEKSRSIIDAGLDDILISVTGITPEVYQRFQGYGKGTAQVKTQFETVVGNVEKFAMLNRKKYNSAVRLGICYCLSDDSLEEAPRAARFWKSKGVDYIHYWPINAGLGKVPETTKRFTRSTGFKPSNFCFETITVLANGDVCVCCNDSIRASVKTLGNAFKSELGDLLSSDSYKSFVKSLIGFEMEKLPECCQKCDLIRMPAAKV
jgi:sulfatase maturation enzyme AslB (radical SAM superfamily)